MPPPATGRAGRLSAPRSALRAILVVSSTGGYASSLCGSLGPRRPQRCDASTTSHSVEYTRWDWRAYSSSGRQPRQPPTPLIGSPTLLVGKLCVADGRWPRKFVCFIRDARRGGPVVSPPLRCIGKKPIMPHSIWYRQRVILSGFLCVNPSSTWADQETPRSSAAA